MRIPKGILKIAKISHDEDPRMMGVALSRVSDDTIRATATNGRTAIIAVFTEPISDKLPGFGDAETAVPGFKKTIPSETAIDADQSTSKDPGFLVVDETAPAKEVIVLAPHPDGRQRWDAGAIDGEPIDVSGAIASHDVIEVEEGGFAVRTRINPAYLLEMVKAMVDAAPDAISGICIEVPLKSNRPLKITRGTIREDGAEITGVIMAMEDPSRRRIVTILSKTPKAKDAAVAAGGI